MKYETVIGLEVHVELSTATKIFCSCPNEFGSDPNSNCCPVCLALPGALPVLNEKVVEYGVKAGMALDCRIPNFSKMDRKGYFYPDLPKAYQISQFDYPLCKEGKVQIEVDGQKKDIRITRIHMEEDAGKLLHEGYGTNTAVDLNRCGVPLLEIVTEPDLRSSAEVKVFLETLKANMQYIEVSDCKMQEGSLRCDVNVSVRPVGQEEYGTRAELKNLNSFSAAVRAVEYEQKRQIEAIEDGEEIVQETRRWDDGKGRSYPMRDKEEAHDYRYFPDPDLVPIVISDEQIAGWRNEMPELPANKMARFIREYGLPEYDAQVLTAAKPVSVFFEECVKAYDNAKIVSNWIMGDVLRLLKDKNMEPEELPVKPEQLVELLRLLDKGVVNNTVAKQVFEEMFVSGGTAKDIIAKKGLEQISDDGMIREMLVKIIKANPKSVEDFKNGKEKALGFFVGQVMRETKGKANPKIVNELVREALSKA